MTSPVVPVSDFHSNAEDQIVRIAKLIGTGAKRKIFEAVYHGKKPVKTVREIRAITDLSEKRILTLGKILHRDRALECRKQGGRVVGYAKIQELINVKSLILRLAGNRDARARVATKRNPKVFVSRLDVTVRGGREWKATRVRIDDVDSFSRVRRISAKFWSGENLDPPRLPETEFKHGVRYIIGEHGAFRDWGGEGNDLNTTHLRIGRKRVDAAFAFKGPGTSGVLTPAKMGHNGDQITRLVDSPADVFFVQYEGDIAESVMRQLAAASHEKAARERRTIRYGTIAKVDSHRLRLAYPVSFDRARRYIRRGRHRRYSPSRWSGRSSRRHR